MNNERRLRAAFKEAGTASGQPRLYTHAELCVTLLTDAAKFFRNMAQSNVDIRAQMTQNAVAFEEMAEALHGNPQGRAGKLSYSSLTADLLRTAATFIRSVAEQNEPIREQMLRSAAIYDEMARRVCDDPLGTME